MTRTVLLGDVVQIKGGKRLPKGGQLQDIPNSHPYLRIVDMGQKYIITANLQYVPNETFSKISRYITNTNDVLVSIVGTIGLVSLVDEGLDNASLTENCVKLICDTGTTNPEFLYYFLTSSTGQNEMHAGRVGSTQPKLPLYNIAKIKIPNLDLCEQTKIVGILSALDEKIELNRQMNETLEQIGQAIFRHYFIGNPEAEKWEQTTLDQICDRIGSGGTPSTKRDDYYGGDVSWFTTKELKDNFLFDSEKSITNSGLEYSAAKLFPKNTIIIAIYAAPTVGRLGILTHKSTFNQAACGLVALPKIGYEFIYLYLLLSRDELNNMANGAAQQNISVGAVRGFHVPLAPDGILLDFRSTIRPIFEQIQNNSKEIQTLTTLRDTLLPRLISGKIKAL